MAISLLMTKGETCAGQGSKLHKVVSCTLQGCSCLPALSSLVAPTHTLLAGTMSIWTGILAVYQKKERGEGDGGREGGKEGMRSEERERVGEK